MKKVAVVLTLLCMVLLAGCSASVNNDDYLRVHIRANSNSQIDQEVKYYAKDVVVTYLSPILKDCGSKKEAVEIITGELKNIENIVDLALKEKGFDYGCSAKIKNEFFPTKTYEDLTLEADYYDALIINLGSGEGQNWWCVMYPNICFNEPSNVVYKSKIKEIIQKLFGE